MKGVIISLGIFCIVLGLALVGLFFGLGIYLSPQSSLTKVDAIVAISGGETSARTDEAVKLYNDGLAPLVIFSGAALDPNGPSNARTMADEAIRQGVPASKVLLDEAAQNTRENASGVAKLTSQNNVHSIILVTSPYHQRRASIVFSRVLGAGVKILNHSSYDSSWRRSHWWATSYSQSLTLAETQKVIFELVSSNPQ